VGGNLFSSSASSSEIRLSCAALAAVTSVVLYGSPTSVLPDVEGSARYAETRRPASESESRAESVGRSEEVDMEDVPLVDLR